MPSNSSAQREATSFEIQSSTPVVGKSLDVGDLVGLVGSPEPIEPTLPCLLVLPGDRLDLADGLLHALDGRLRTPTEGMAAKARPELPEVRLFSHSFAPKVDGRSRCRSPSCRAPTSPSPRLVTPAATRSSPSISSTLSCAPGARSTFSSQLSQLTHAHRSVALEAKVAPQLGLGRIGPTGHHRKAAVRGGVMQPRGSPFAPA